MPSPKRLSELIHAIYAAAESPERWEHFLSIEMVSQRDLVRTPFYNDFARKVGINRSLTATIVVARFSRSAGMRCNRPTG